MSVTDVKAKAPKKASSKKITKAQEAALKIALEAAAVEYVGVRLEFGNYPTLSFSSLTGDFVPLIGNP